MDTGREPNRIEQGSTAAPAAGARTSDRPFFWRVATGVLYAEMPYTRVIRPPLLTPWESDRVMAFRNRERRSRWLAGRALAKVLVKERLGMPGVVEIREGADGEPLVFRDGFPMPEVWLGICVRHGRVSCVIADRPVSLEVRRAEDHEFELVESFASGSELRQLRRTLGTARASRSVAWAVKEAGLRAVRARGSHELRAVRVDSEFGVHIGERHLHTLAVRVVDDVAVAIVGRQLLEEQGKVRIVLDAQAREDATPKLQAAIERSVARARRITDARTRWQRVRLQG